MYTPKHPDHPFRPAILTAIPVMLTTLKKYVNPAMLTTKVKTLPDIPAMLTTL
ncbi:MAG: hypothetical protein ABIQ31_17440 [Ferruginibacter sp.]